MTALQSRTVHLSPWETGSHWSTNKYHPVPEDSVFKLINWECDRDVKVFYFQLCVVYKIKRKKILQTPAVFLRGKLILQAQLGIYHHDCVVPSGDSKLSSEQNVLTGLGWVLSETSGMDSTFVWWFHRGNISIKARCSPRSLWKVRF